METLRSLGHNTDFGNEPRKKRQTFGDQMCVDALACVLGVESISFVYLSLGFFCVSSEPMTWITAKWQKPLELPQGWKPSGSAEEIRHSRSSGTWGAEHSTSLGLWRQTLPLQKPPTPRSPCRKNVGCSVDGAISTKSVLNNPLPRYGKGHEWVGRDMFCVRERPKSWGLVPKGCSGLCVQLFFLSLGKKRQPGWNLTNRWNSERGWPLSVLVWFECVAEHQPVQSDLRREQTKHYKILPAPQNSPTASQVGHSSVSSVVTVSALAMASLLPQVPFPSQECSET